MRSRWRQRAKFANRLGARPWRQNRRRHDRRLSCRRNQCKALGRSRKSRDARKTDRKQEDDRQAMDRNTRGKRSRRLWSALRWNCEFEQCDLSHLFHRRRLGAKIPRDYPASSVKREIIHQMNKKHNRNLEANNAIFLRRSPAACSVGNENRRERNHAWRDRQSWHRRISPPIAHRVCSNPPLR